jgi:hypothetical protein
MVTVMIAMVTVMTVAVVAIAMVTVAVVATVAVVDRFAVAVSPIVTTPVGGRHRRQQGEREHRNERRQPGSASGCVSVTQEIPPNSVIDRGASPVPAVTVRETNIRRSI